jgi:Type II secretory pathway, component PulF
VAKHPIHFSELYIATIKAGEQSGNLAEVLQRFIAYLKLMIGLRQKVSKALAYPAFLVMVGISVIGFLLTYVVPTFVSVYAEIIKSLPVATQLLLDLVTGGKVYLLPGLAGLAALGLAGRAYYVTLAGRLVVDQLLLRVPVLGPIFVKHYTVQLTRTLATILAGGTPLVDALSIARGAISNRYVSFGVAGAVGEIRKGRPWPPHWTARKYFPNWQWKCCR